MLKLFVKFKALKLRGFYVLRKCYKWKTYKWLRNTKTYYNVWGYRITITDKWSLCDFLPINVWI